MFWGTQTYSKQNWIIWAGSYHKTNINSWMQHVNEIKITKLNKEMNKHEINEINTSKLTKWTKLSPIDLWFLSLDSCTSVCCGTDMAALPGANQNSSDSSWHRIDWMLHSVDDHHYVTLVKPFQSPLASSMYDQLCRLYFQSLEAIRRRNKPWWVQCLKWSLQLCLLSALHWDYYSCCYWLPSHCLLERFHIGNLSMRLGRRIHCWSMWLHPKQRVHYYSLSIPPRLLQSWQGVWPLR